MGNFDPIKHGRGFHGRFTEMGLSARALQERFGVNIHGLGAARQRYQVTDKNGSNLGHVQRLSDNNFHAVHVEGHTHPDGPFPTRAMAGAAVADMHGVFADKYPQAHQSLKRAAFRSGESRIAASVAARREAERIAAEPVRDRPARGPRKHLNGPEPKAKNGYEYKLVQKEPARIQGTTQVLKKYHVLHNGEKVGEIRHEKYYHQIMEGRLRAGLRHDFTAYQVHEGSSDYPRRVAHGGQAFTLKEAKDAAEKHFDDKAAERAEKEGSKPSEKKPTPASPKKDMGMLRYKYQEARKRMNNARGPQAAQAAEKAMERAAEELRAMGAVQDARGNWKMDPEERAAKSAEGSDRFLRRGATIKLAGEEGTFKLGQREGQHAYVYPLGAKIHPGTGWPEDKAQVRKVKMTDITEAQPAKPVEEPGDAARLHALRDQVETARVRQRMATDRRLDFNGIGSIDNPRGGWKPKLEAGLPRQPTEEQMRHAAEQERNAYAGLRAAQRDMFHEALRQGKAYTIKEHDRLDKRPFEITPSDSIINAVGPEAYRREGQKIGVRVARYQTREAAEKAIQEMTKKELQRIGDEESAIRAKSDDELKAAAHRDPEQHMWPDQRAEEELYRRGYHIVDGQYHKVHDPNAPKHNPMVVGLSRNLIAQPHKDEAYPAHGPQAEERFNRSARETKERGRRMFGMNPDITKHGEEGMPGKGQGLMLPKA